MHRDRSHDTANVDLRQCAKLQKIGSVQVRIRGLLSYLLRHGTHVMRWRMTITIDPLALTRAMMVLDAERLIVLIASCTPDGSELMSRITLAVLPGYTNDGSTDQQVGHD
jgi:hypothetical protein